MDATTPTAQTQVGRAAPPVAAAVDARLRRVHRPWRTVLLAYAVALTVATHWPRLQLGTEEFRVSDKILHTGAFGAAALLLWMSGLVRRPFRLLLVGLAWAAVDEITQGLPGLGRTISWLDLLASSVGVAAVASMLWAFGPVGRRGGVAWRATRRRAWAMEEALGTWRAVGLCALGALGLLPVGALLGWMIFSLPRIEQPSIGMETGAILAVGTGAMMTMEVLRRRVLRRAGRSCFECGADAAESAFDESGAGACQNCGEALHATQWSDPPLPPWANATRLVVVAALAAVAMVAVTFAGTLVIGWLAIHMRSPLVAELNAMGRQGDAGGGYDMGLVLEFLAISLVAAASVRATRVVLARAMDRQHVRCMGCRFDLRGTPLAVGRGTCPECGRAFVASGT